MSLLTFLLPLSGTAQEGTVDIDTMLNVPEVVVTGTRNEVDIRHLPLSVVVVDSAQIAGSYQQSLLPIVTEQVPGLFTTSRGIMGYGVSTGASGTMSMRGVGGAPTTGMLILIDGHPQYMGLMGHPIADAYQSMLAEKVEVVKGPASVLYGSNAMGGVINILTKKSAQDEFKNSLNASYGSFNTLTTELNSRFKKDKFSAMVTGSYNRTDGHRDNMDFEQYGGYAKVGYDFSSHWNVFADVSLTHYNASNPGTVDAPIYDNDSRITRGMASLSLDNKYDRSSGSFKLFYNWGHHNINDGYYEGGSPKDYLFNSKDDMFGLTYYQSISLFEGNRLTAGVDYQSYGGYAWNEYTDGSESDIIDSDENLIAGYVDFRQDLGRIITLDAGIRLDHHSVTGSHWIPQFGASVRPLASGEIKLIASHGFRNPTIKELYMFTSQNPELEPESLWNYEISWSQRLLGGRLSYGVNLFYIDGENMIQTAMVDGSPLNVNTGAIENWGAELMASYALSSRFSLSANYSWLKMQNPILASPEHKGYLSLDFHSGRWTASTSIQYIGGLYTDISSTYAQEYYTLWSARCSYRLCDSLNLYLKGENLLDQDYEVNQGFVMPGANVMFGAHWNF